MPRGRRERNRSVRCTHQRQVRRTAIILVFCARRGRQVRSPLFGRPSLFYEDFFATTRQVPRGDERRNRELRALETGSQSSSRLIICIQLPRTTNIKKTLHLGFVARLNPIMRVITKSRGLRRTLPCSGSEPS